MNPLSRHARVAILLTVFMIPAAMLYAAVNSRPIESTLRDLTAPVTYNQATIIANGKQETVTLPAVIHTNEPFVEIIELTNLPHQHGQGLAVFNTYTDFYAMIDGQEVYRFESNKNFPIRSGGYAVHIIDIPEPMVDAKVELHYFPTLKSVKEYKLSPVDAGRRINIYLNKLLLREIWIYLTAAILIAIFLIMVAASLLNWRTRLRENRIRPTAALSLMLGGYLLPQAWTFNYLLGRYSLLAYVMEYTALMMLAAPAVSLIRGKLDKKYNTLLMSVMMLSFTNMLVQYFLSFTGVMEFKQMLPVTHLTLIAAALAIIIAFAGTDGAAHPEKKPLLLSLVPIIAFMVLAVIDYWFTNRFVLTEVIALGMLVFIILQFYSATISYKTIAESVVRNRVYEQLALKDVLTGLDNRTAFVKFLDEEEEKNRSCSVISIDLNDLKKVNDTYGHTYGDQTLQLFGKVLAESFADYPSARTFRIGGDEFTAFVFEPGFDFNTWLSSLRHLRASAIKDKSGISLGFAVGHQVYRKNSEMTLRDVISDSDRLMYLNKADVKRLAH